MSLSSVTVQGKLSGIHCINVFSASLIKVSFHASSIILMYIDTSISISNNATVAHSTISSLSFFRGKYNKPLYTWITNAWIAYNG